MADALASGASEGNLVGVQVPSSVPNITDDVTKRVLPLLLCGNRDPN